MMDIIKMLGFPGQARAPNTIDLRNQWNKYAIDAQLNNQIPVPFEQWAQQMYPERKILGSPPVGLLNQ